MVRIGSKWRRLRVLKQCSISPQCQSVINQNQIKYFTVKTQYITPILIKEMELLFLKILSNRLILYNKMTNKKSHTVETILKSMGLYLCNLKNILALAILYASSQTCVFLIMGVYLKLRKYAWDSTIMPCTCFTICHIYPNLDEEKKNSKKYHSWQMIQYYCKK